MNAALPGHVCSFPRIAVEYLLSERSIFDRKNGRSPKIIRLEKYDQANHTDLTETLKYYLYYERSVKKTSAKLYIHKNTVVYRINMLREMFGLDLEDDRERQYILLSLMLS